LTYQNYANTFQEYREGFYPTEDDILPVPGDGNDVLIISPEEMARRKLVHSTLEERRESLYDFIWGTTWSTDHEASRAAGQLETRRMIRESLLDDGTMIEGEEEASDEEES